MGLCVRASQRACVWRAFLQEELLLPLLLAQAGAAQVRLISHKNDNPTTLTAPQHSAQFS